jgi:phage tail sheath protein FI
MPDTPTYPGIYIEELPSGVHAITAVATSIAAFVDFFAKGPLDQAVQIFNPGDFNRQFGGLDSRSEASYAIQQFFLNGGSRAYVVRVTSGTAANAAKTAAIVIQDGSGNNILLVSAASAGAWGNDLRVDVDYGTTDPTKLFNLTATLVDNSTPPRVVATETFRNLTVDSTKSNFVVNVVKNNSQLITTTLLAATAMPARTGTVSSEFTAIGLPWAANTKFAVGTVIVDGNGNLEVVTAATGAGQSGGAAPVWPTAVGHTVTDLHDLNNGLTWKMIQAVPAGKALSLDRTETMRAGLNTIAPLAQQVQLGSLTPPVPITFAWLAGMLQGLIRKLDPSLANATVTVVGSSSTAIYLQFKAGTSTPADYLYFNGNLATALGISSPVPPGTPSANTNVQQYALGSSVARQAQALPGGAQQAGDDGKSPADDPAGLTLGIIGDPLKKSGLYALMDVDLFNILSIPATMNLPDTDAAQVAAAANILCESRRAFYILDPPQADGNRDTVGGIQAWLDTNASVRDNNVALYFPRLDIADPLNNFQLRKVAPSGTVAGLYARIDGARGVWKAPAGTEATLAGVQALEYKLTDPENGVLNPLAINCLRNFPIYGPVCWGARTLEGADQIESQWKYIPVRRLALFLEESLYRGTKWVVFEPNDEPLWAQIRLNVGAFMQTLFRQGAFQGSSPQQAYLVKCDSETTTQTDIDNGVVNILVGFAPLKPAEFVIIQIEQLAGQNAA